MSQFPPVVDVRDIDGDNGFKISASSSFGYTGISVASAGDINGDGFDDVIVGSLYATPHGVSGGYVVFGKAGGFDADIGGASLDGTNGFMFTGATAGDNAGGSVASAGDVNGDGFDGIIIGAPRAVLYDSQNFQHQSGAAYVVFGKASGFDSNLQLSSLDGSDGFKLSGSIAFFGAGGSVASAGDINGDGYADVMVSGFTSQASYVVFGKASGFSADTDLSTLNGSNGFTLSGSATTVASAGDVNGDGIADMIVGNGSNGSYVVFGKAGGGFGSNVDVSSLDGVNGFKLSGSNFSVASAGDVNGDGYDDVIANGIFVGTSYVVFGKASGFDSNINLTTLNGSNGFKLTGPGIVGWSVSSAGDVNGDGFDDLILGDPFANVGAHAPHGYGAGISYVVFGKASGFGANFDLSSLDGDSGFRIYGDYESDSSGRSVSAAGDVNGDGFADLIIGAPYANSNGANKSGAAYTVFGRAPDTAVDRTGTNASQTLAGGAFNDVLHGLGGDDKLYGNGGDDQLFGGTGDDTYYVDSAGDTVREALNQGTDTIHTTVSFKLAPNVEILIADSDAGLKLSGNVLDNTIIGGAGNDNLNGGLGADHMDGGAGDDVYLVDNVGDTVTDSAGNDLVRTTINYTLGADIERLRAGSDAGLILNGNDLGNGIIGGAGNDTLFGGLGRDILIGGDGNDTFVYRSTAESGTTSATRDTISDFNTGDVIDLSEIDAIAGGAHDDFTFIGNGAFTAAGQVRWEVRGDDTIVQVNTEGSLGADMSILLRGDHSLTVDDFKLS